MTHLEPAARGGALPAGAGSTSGEVPDAGLREQLRELARRRIFFAHASVGASVVDALGRLAGREGVPLAITEFSSSVVAPAPGITHGWLPANGDPLAKLDAFARALASAGEPDVALVKLCYADFGPDTDARAVLGAYRRTIAALAAAHPRTTFVHATVPLTAVGHGPRAWARRLLGRTSSALAANLRRDSYNAVLRACCAGREPLFDLARLESTRPDGSAAAVELDGRAIPVLVADYTDDGGHLNARGSAGAARELAAVLASAANPRRDDATRAPAAEHARARPHTT